MMTERLTPLPCSAYKTTIAGTRGDAGKFRGLVGCAPTFDAKHPDYHEVVCAQLRDSRSAAKRDASALQVLRERLLDTPDVVEQAGTAVIGEQHATSADDAMVGLSHADCSVAGTVEI
jgi:hypothetical protein